MLGAAMLRILPVMVRSLLPAFREFQGAIDKDIPSTSLGSRGSCPAQQNERLTAILDKITGQRSLGLLIENQLQCWLMPEHYS